MANIWLLKKCAKSAPNQAPTAIPGVRVLTIGHIMAPRRCCANTAVIDVIMMVASEVAIAVCMIVSTGIPL